MANHKSTRKSVRKNAARRDRNRYYGKTTRNAIRSLLAITDKKEATEQMPKVMALIDKLAKTNVIHKNKAGNLKSGIAKKVATMA